MRRLILTGSDPVQWGLMHGESWRGEIQSLCAIRTYLCTRIGGFPDGASVLAAARAHLPVLEAYDRALYQELCGIARGANVSPEEIVVANHYTDLRDLPPDPAAWQPAPTADRPGYARGAPDATSDAAAAAQGDGCSVLWAANPERRIVAQTWDMHATAIPYVMVVEVPETEHGPAAKLLSVTGCLGMAGANAARVGMAINNLFSTDATVGVVWPAMVRRALRERSATAALAIVEQSPIGSGHHYFVADQAQAYAVETSGTRRRRMYTGAPATYIHTNHCLDPEIGACSKIPPTSTTLDRYAWLTQSVAAAELVDLDDAWQRLGSQEGWPRSVSTNMATPENPHGAATCGAFACDLRTGEFWAQAGFITNVRAERFQL